MYPCVPRGDVVRDLGAQGEHETEVHDHDPPVSQDDVGRVDVHVREAAAMQVPERGDQFRDDVQGVACGDAASGVDDGAEGVALDVLQDDERDRRREVASEEALIRGVLDPLEMRGLASEDAPRPFDVGAGHRDLDGDRPAVGQRPCHPALAETP